MIMPWETIITKSQKRPQLARVEIVLLVRIVMVIGEQPNSVAEDVAKSKWGYNRQ